MVPEIKDAGESCSREFSFLPLAIRSLGPEEVVDAPCYRRMLHDTRVQQAQERPGGL